MVVVSGSWWLLASVVGGSGVVVHIEPGASNGAARKREKKGERKNKRCPLSWLQRKMRKPFFKALYYFGKGGDGSHFRRRLENMQEVINNYSDISFLM